MSLSTLNKTVAFAIGLILLLTMPVLYPKARLMYFAPYLVISFYQREIIGALWSSFACGVIVDFLSSGPLMGVNALGYCLTTAVLYRLKIHFFADSHSTLPIMTLLVSFGSTLVNIPIQHLLQNNVIFNTQFFYTDLIIMPFVDSVYAFALFNLPRLIFGKPRRKGREYFLQR